MSWDVVIVAAVLGVAVGWLTRRFMAALRRRKDAGCAGGCGCAAKSRPKR